MRGKPCRVTVISFGRYVSLQALLKDQNVRRQTCVTTTHLCESRQPKARRSPALPHRSESREGDKSLLVVGTVSRAVIFRTQSQRAKSAASEPHSPVTSSSSTSSASDCSCRLWKKVVPGNDQHLVPWLSWRRTFSSFSRV
jgi:hypothetical protein